eukprot:362433-Chlamydomonas_euryale.AAC.3
MRAAALSALACSAAIAPRRPACFAALAPRRPGLLRRPGPSRTASPRDLPPLPQPPRLPRPTEHDLVCEPRPCSRCRHTAHAAKPGVRPAVIFPPLLPLPTRRPMQQNLPSHVAKHGVRPGRPGVRPGRGDALGATELRGGRARAERPPGGRDADGGAAGGKHAGRAAAAATGVQGFAGRRPARRDVAPAPGEQASAAGVAHAAPATLACTWCEHAHASALGVNVRMPMRLV